eukprot:261829_1
MPNGYCAASISKCKLHRQYLCSDCHQVTATGLLKKTPEYLPETQKACTWNGHPKKSIPKHSKRYHGTQSKHAQYWRACMNLVNLPYKSNKIHKIQLINIDLKLYTNELTLFIYYTLA